MKSDLQNLVTKGEELQTSHILVNFTYLSAGGLLARLHQEKKEEEDT